MISRKLTILIVFTLLSLCACSKDTGTENSSSSSSSRAIVPAGTMQSPAAKQQETAVQPGQPSSVPAASAAKQPETPMALPFDEVTPENTGQAEKLYDQGFNLYMHSRYDEAIEYCDRAIKADPDCYKAYNVKGIALCFKGDYIDGMNLIKKSLDMKPDFVYANFNMAMAYKLQKDYDNALVWFNKAISLDPNDTWSYYGISTIYADRDQVEKSLEYLKKAIILDASVKDVAKEQDHFSKMRKNPGFAELIKSNIASQPEPSAGLGKESIPVLMYHSIIYEEGNPVRMAKESFEAQMKWLSENGYATLTMDELFDHISNETDFPEKSVVVTLDDGYRDNYTNAYPILKKYGIHATVFMISDATGHNDYLTEEQIKEMSANGIDVQSHTVHHPNLDELSYENQYKELKESKEYLEKLTGKKVEYLAYPMGRYNSDTIKALKDLGYKMAFRMSGGWAGVHNSRYEISRVYVGGFDSLDTFIGKIVR